MAAVEQTTRQTAPEAPLSRGEIARIAPPRLPYHPEMQERFGVDRSAWRALVEAVFPAARTAEGVLLALSYCKARKLDPFKRPVHVVPIWDSQRGSYVESVWPGIGELRTTAFRTGNYAGSDAATFGPDVTEVFKGRVKAGRDGWKDVSVTVTFPEWCQMTVYRLLSNGQRAAIPGPRVYWRETYAKQGKADVPNEMWAKRPRGQLEKCAEAAALRRAFPEEIGNELAAEEVAGQSMETLSGAVIDPDAPPPPARPQRGPVTTVHEPAEVAAEPAVVAVEIEAEEIAEAPEDEAAAGWSDWLAIRQNEADSYSDAADLDEMKATADDVMQREGAPLEIRQQFAAIYAAAMKRVGGKGRGR